MLLLEEPSDGIHRQWVLHFGEIELFFIHNNHELENSALKCHHKRQILILLMKS